MRKKLLICLIICTILIVSTSIVLATETISKQPTFWDKILAFLRGGGTFSVVGQARHCDVNPTQEWTLAPNEAFQRTQANCLFDVFVENYVPVKEYKDSVNIMCGSTQTQCIVQMYCNCDAECPATPCPSGSECLTSTQADPYIPLNFASWTYCSASCTGSPITCWRIEGSSCASRTYTCDYETYPNCPTSYPYTSYSQCQSNIVCTDTSWSPDSSTICSGTSFTQTSNCGNTRTSTGTKNCGTCTNGQTQSCDTSDGCAGTQTCSSGSWGACVRDDPNCGTNLEGSESLTMSDFLSASYFELANSACITNSDCKSSSNATVTCDVELGERLFKEALKEDCNTIVSTLALNIPILSGLVAGTICAIPNSAFSLIQEFTDLGVCKAVPNSGFSKYYNQALEMIYNLGVPRGWVVVVLFIALILILLVIISIFK